MKYLYSLLMFAFLFQPLMAEEETPSVKVTPMLSEEVQITAGQLDMDYDKQQAVFTEDVKVIDHRIEIYSDKMVILFDDKQEVKELTATRIGGLVKVILHNADQTETIARAKKVNYNTATGQVTLTGQAKVTNEKGNLGNAEQIICYLDEQGISRVIAKSVSGSNSSVQMKLKVGGNKLNDKDKK